MSLYPNINLKKFADEQGKYVNTNINLTNFVIGQWNSARLYAIQPHIGETYKPSEVDVIAIAFNALNEAGLSRSSSWDLMSHVILLRQTSNDNRSFLVQAIAFGILFTGTLALLVYASLCTDFGSDDRVTAMICFLATTILGRLHFGAQNFNPIAAHCNAANSTVTLLQNLSADDASAFARALKNPTICNNPNAKKLLQAFQNFIPKQQDPNGKKSTISKISESSYWVLDSNGARLYKVDEVE